MVPFQVHLLAKGSYASIKPEFTNFTSAVCEYNSKRQQDKVVMVKIKSASKELQRESSVILILRKGALRVKVPSILTKTIVSACVENINKQSQETVRCGVQNSAKGSSDIHTFITVPTATPTCTR